MKRKPEISIHSFYGCPTLGIGFRLEPVKPMTGLSPICDTRYPCEAVPSCSAVLSVRPLPLGERAGLRAQCFPGPADTPRSILIGSYSPSGVHYSLFPVMSRCYPLLLDQSKPKIISEINWLTKQDLQFGLFFQQLQQR